jgi:periplasmic copper chaperone A
MTRNTLILASGLALFAGGAFAHATLEQSEAAAGATTKITLRVPHGCAGEATHTLRIDLPEGFHAAKPMPKAGWALETETGPYATPFDNHGQQMTEGVRAVTWSGGNLEDGWYDEFTLRGTVGPDVAPGTVLYFPALQTCASGTADWTDTSGAADAPNPAPSLTIVAGGDAGHGYHHDAAADKVTIGALEIAGGYSRATLPNAPVAGGFMAITNTREQDDRLTGATSDIAGRVEVHEMTMENDVMRMRAVEAGLPIPAGETVTLAPGGYHLMFMDLAGPLVEGQTVTVTLQFEQAGEVEVPLAVGAPDAKGHDHAAHDGQRDMKADN